LAVPDPTAGLNIPSLKTTGEPDAASGKYEKDRQPGPARADGRRREGGPRRRRARPARAAPGRTAATEYTVGDPAAAGPSHTADAARPRRCAHLSRGLRYPGPGGGRCLQMVGAAPGAGADHEPGRSGRLSLRPHGIAGRLAAGMAHMLSAHMILRRGRTAVA